MDPNSGHLVRDLDGGLVSPEDRKKYEQLNEQQAELAKSLLGERDEMHLTRQQIRRLQRMVDKQEKK